jgi:hypothetical protein
VGGAIEGDVAGVQHQVGPFAQQRLADAAEVVDEEWLVVAEVGIGDLGDAKRHGEDAK